MISDGAWQVLLGIIASAITGFAVWFTQRTVWRRQLRRKRRFFGLTAGEDCLLVVNRHASSSSDVSVHRTDVAALLQVAAVIEACGARARIHVHDRPDEVPIGLSEFCIGGPDSNARTAAHLRVSLPGLTISTCASDPKAITIHVGGVDYPREPGVIEYAAVAKIAPTAGARPIFLVCGQTAYANQGGVGYLVSRRPDLVRAHGLDGPFCLIVRVREPWSFGPNRVELVRDVTEDAFVAPDSVASASNPNH